MTPRAAAPVIVLALIALAAWPAAADASTISGRVAAGRAPAAGKGFATVRAVGAQDLVIADVDRIRSGRYSLKVPAGRYHLFAATTPFRGKAGVDRSAGKVRVRAGKRKTQRVSLRKPKRKQPKLPKIPGFPTARAAFVQVKHPAVWVQHFAVSGGSEDLKALRKGLADMLITDIGPPLAAACGGVIVEREKLSWLIAEQLRSQGPGFDPSTRLPTDKMIAHNREVTGTLTVTGATMTLTATVTNPVTGAARSVTRSSAADRFFELEQSIIQEVVRLICGDKPPAAYSGLLSGSMSAADGASSQTLSWSGNVRLRFNGDVIGEVGDDPPGEYAYYEPESGSVNVVIDGVDGECTYHGETSVTIVPARGEHSNRVQQGVDEPSYSLLAKLPDGAAMPVTTTGPSHCGGGSTTPYPLGGRVYLTTEGTRRSSSTMLAGAVSHPIGPVALKWAWSLAPQAN